jgi:hypothetical protein
MKSLNLIRKAQNVARKAIQESVLAKVIHFLKLIHENIL